MAFTFLRKKNRSDIDLDETFLDSHNSPAFDTQQFEGHIERPISALPIRIFGAFAIFILIVLGGRLFKLEIVEGQQNYKRSVENTLLKTSVIAERGVIYDRNQVELAWNSERQGEEEILKRSYIRESGLAHVLGYVSYPKRDKSGNFWQSEYIGRAGAELYWNDSLSGKNGLSYYETDAQGNVVSAGGLERSISGRNVNLSVDARLQNIFYESLEGLSNDIGYQGAAGILMDVENGEVLTLTSYPEFDSEILSFGDDNEIIQGYIQSPKKPFLDRAILGLYAPGSIVKPFIALAALNEGVITPEKIIVSTGSISLPNPYAIPHQ